MPSERTNRLVNAAATSSARRPYDAASDARPVAAAMRDTSRADHEKNAVDSTSCAVLSLTLSQSPYVHWVRIRSARARMLSS